MVSPDDVRIIPFVRRVAAGALDADSRLWRSFRALLLRPGHLTAEYIQGRRRPYLNPMQIFLLANLLFFTVLSTIGGFNTFTTQLHYHITQSGYGPIAERMIAPHGAHNTPEHTAYTKRFDERTPRYANSLVILMVPMFAAVLLLLYGGRHYFVHHLTLSLHFYAFLLIVLVALSLLLRGLALISPRLLESVDSEIPLTIVLLITFTLYLAASLRRTFGDRLAPSLLRGAAASCLLLPVIVAYRMLLFFAVYYTLD